MSAPAVEVEVDGRRLRLSNLDKVLYPEAGFTKGAVIDYYTRIAPVLLPHVRDRPLTLKRYPNGVDAPHFYEKQSPSHRPDWVRTVAVRHSDRTVDYTLADDLPTLVWLANLADLELHTSLARSGDIDMPTMVMFDLDPGEPAGLVECCRVALLLREVLDGVALQSFAKTSGSKGMQVVVPLNTPVGYAETKSFARALAELLVRHEPELVVSSMSKKVRGGRVLVDWSQNDRRKTTVCVYSLRARAQPTVSTPLRWDEVEAAARAGDAGDLDFGAADALARADREGDLHAPVEELEQRLPAG